MTPTPTNALTDLAALSTRIDSLLSLNKITLTDLRDFSSPERERLGQVITEKLSRLTGPERDKYLDKIELILPAEMKNTVWEHNHMCVRTAISNHLNEYSVMPTKNVLAKATGLSRQTVAKHIKEYTSHPEFTGEMEQFKFMSHNVLANVFKFASKGDMKAARLYFEMTGAINKQRNGSVVNEQNNYIQINNTILSQENLKQLTAEQLNQIEKIVNDKEYSRV